MAKRYVWVSLFFYTIFLGVLMYFAVVKYASLLFELPESLITKALEISNIIESLSHIATVGVFGWAVWTFCEQQIDKRNDDAIKRASSYSIRLINYIGDKEFILTQQTVSVLNAYLDVLRSEIDDKNISDCVKKEAYLAFVVVREGLKNVQLKDMLGYEFDGTYEDIIEELSSIYSDKVRLNKFDKSRYDLIYTSGTKLPKKVLLNPPSTAIGLKQIEHLVNLVFGVSEGDDQLELGVAPTFAGRAHEYPELYAMYYFYEHGSIDVDENGTLKVVFN